MFLMLAELPEIKGVTNIYQLYFRSLQNTKTPGALVHNKARYIIGTYRYILYRVRMPTG